MAYDCTDPLYRPLIRYDDGKLSFNAIAFQLSTDRLLYAHDILINTGLSTDKDTESRKALIFTVKAGKAEDSKIYRFKILDVILNAFSASDERRIEQKFKSDVRYSGDGSVVKGDERLLNPVSSISCIRVDSSDTPVSGALPLVAQVCAFPCGKCLNCRLHAAKEMALRISHESAMHEKVSFVTLTYNDEKVPMISVKNNDALLLFRCLPVDIRKNLHSFLQLGLSSRSTDSASVSYGQYGLARGVPRRLLKEYDERLKSLKSAYKVFRSAFISSLYAPDSVYPDRERENLLNILDKYFVLDTFIADFELKRPIELPFEERKKRLKACELSALDPSFDGALYHGLQKNPYLVDGDFLTCSGRDLLLFMKFLRKHLSEKYHKSIRFFAASDYGGKTMRPHYHIVIFGHDFSDSLISGKEFRSDKGNITYMSSDLCECWPYGFAYVSPVVTPEIASYVARYSTKKATLQDRLDELCVEPLKSTMSLKPGIGTEWFKKYGLTDALAHGYIVTPGSDGTGYRSAIPAYYLLLGERYFPESVQAYKEKVQEYIENVMPKPVMLSDMSYRDYFQNHKISQTVSSEEII